MSGHVLFQMSEPFRHSLISNHKFYVEQARKRLLSQFDNIETEADKAAEQWLERSSSRFDPDRDDPAGFYETAHEIGIEFYGLLSDMRDRTWLSVVAGMFHEWDKQLRSWLVREIEHWHHGENFPKKIWSADFVEISEFLDCLGWRFSSTGYSRKLDACRLVINVYKHGDGRSFDDLKERYPDYLDARFKDLGFTFASNDLRDHTHLKVSEEQFQTFSDAIIEFWKAVPENTQESDSEPPKWVEKMISKDRAINKKTSSK
jgi:hypothetical protein